MQRRIPPADRHTPPGVTLTTSTMGGYSVHRGDNYLGYIHTTGPGRFRAYARHNGPDDLLLGGELTHDQAVTAVVTAFDRRLPVPTGAHHA